MCYNTNSGEVKSDQTDQNTNSDEVMSYQTYQTYSCTKCGSRSDVSQVHKYQWYCTVCFKEAHRDSKRELKCITERRWSGPELYKLAREQYWKEFDTVLTSTVRNQNELLEEACQHVGPRIARGQMYCDEATAEWARSIFRQRVEAAIKECFENLRE